MLRSQKYTTLIYKAYVFCSGYTTMWVASRHSRQPGSLCLVTHRFTHADGTRSSSLCWHDVHLLLYSWLRVCFFSEYMRRRVCLSLLGQCCECFTSHQPSWDANGLCLTLDVPLAVTFSSCEWIINSRTRTSRTFLWTILWPHDLWIRNALRLVMSVWWNTRFLVYFQALSDVSTNLM
jgi:hypothetical protein